MMLQIDAWTLLCALAALVAFFLGVVAWFGRMLLAQFERRQEERFKARDESLTAIRDQIVAMDRRGQRVEEHVLEVEKDLMRLRAELPSEYVRREDWIRFSGTIDAKLDWLRLQTESLSRSVARMMAFVKQGSDSDGG